MAAGVLTFEDALKAVRFRGEAMQDAVPVGVGAMAAVVGLSPAAVGISRPRSGPPAKTWSRPITTPSTKSSAGHPEPLWKDWLPQPRRGGQKWFPWPSALLFTLMVPAGQKLASHPKALPFHDGNFPVVATSTAQPVVSGNRSGSA